MQRILIVGCGGAGKSTLAKNMASHLNLPVIHLDQHYWNPGWVESNKEEWESKVSELIKADIWIMDGNYGGTLDMRIHRADTIIFLDRSRWVCLWNILKRWWKYRGMSRPDITEECPERLDLIFFHYILTYNNTRRPQMLKRLNNLKETHQILILRNRKQINQLLESL